MIQAIGFMVGAYILLRCLSFMSRSGDYKEHWFVQFAAVCTFFWTLLCMAALLFSGVSAPTALR